MNFKHLLAAASLVLDTGLLALGTLAAAQSTLNGRGFSGSAAIADATVTLWGASGSAPAQLGQTRTDANGRFSLPAVNAGGPGGVVYLVAKGGQVRGGKGTGENSAIALMTALGSAHPSKVTINEMTTVASVWTHAQSLDGAAITGRPLGLRIAAGNVASFVKLETGGWGDDIGHLVDPSLSPFYGG